LETHPGFEGATIRIDGVDRGELVRTAGQEIAVSPGTRELELVVDGEALYSDFVQVQTGARVTVRPPPPPGAAAASRGRAGVADRGDEAGDGDGARPQDASRGPRDRLLVGVGLELAGRRFRFKNPVGNVRPYDAGALPLVRVLAELYPFARSSSRYLGGIGLTGSFARAPFAIASSTAPQAGMPAEEIPTTLSGLDVGAVYRHDLAGNYHVGAGVHYGRQQFEF